MTARSWIVVAAAFGLAVGLAYGLRFGLVENEAAVAACAERPGGIGCVLREAAIFAFHHLLAGLAALAGSFLSLAWPRPWSFLLALVPAAFALVLYNVELGATAVTLCLFATARAAPRRAPA